ncbi:PAS domain-containing protein [Arcobacter sp. CECT 8985]|uniref:PAS domain-containing protein n=1 Tax=Arcobacter sp. CECT 8985 TaxID=1935424 RepID=UPI00100A7E13|nr:PAS domain-containing protein [Arcobacter sp. CECT 8985]RXJ87540.1 PAS sensor domain-containing protein [Arcobacter sp. CECT 8985]
MANGQETVLNEYAFLVSETDKKGNITFANDDFCEIAEYTLDELIGKPHNIVRHKDMPKKAFKDLWNTIKQNKIWTGYVKNATKSGGYYWVYATIYPFQNSKNEDGYLSCRRRASQQEIKDIEVIYKQWIEEENISKAS